MTHSRRATFDRANLVPVSESMHLVTAADMDGMTPAQRASIVDGSVVRDWSAVPADFRQQIEETASRLVAARRTDV
ncbi:MAG: hypothetical protein JWR83_3466 [Aeromicrobium sp.]|nr:hypothetical protein [Aeromicrobium sp.]